MKRKFYGYLFQEMPDYAFAGWGARTRVKIANRQCISMLNLLGLLSWGLIAPTEGMPVVYLNQVRNF